MERSISRNHPMSNLRKARLTAGFTLEEAAKRSRYSAAYIRSAETGGCLISWVMAERLSRLYNCNMTLFLLKSDDPEQLPRKPRSGITKTKRRTKGSERGGPKSAR